MERQDVRARIRFYHNLRCSTSRGIDDWPPACAVSASGIGPKDGAGPLSPGASFGVTFSIEHISPGSA